MANLFSLGVLGLSGLFCLFTSVFSGLQPQAFARQLGLQLTNAGGFNEIRAQYAGVFLATAALCGVAILGLAPRSFALVVLMVTFGGLLAGRLVSLAINGGFAGFPPAIIQLYAIDGTGLVLAGAALFMNARSA